ncbi:MAG: hypothetical protein OEP95_03455 [Myxococcales bacterium]|nr:hypothetical protein [Myxococcales bacterium]
MSRGLFQRRARLACLAWLAVATASAAVSAAGSPPRCRLEVEVAPERPLVGEQVLYSLHILRRHDVSELRWEQPLTFPTFRAEWLPGAAADRTVVRSGETYQVYVERRALFAVHPGTLDLPPASVRCTTEGGEEIVEAPRRRLTVLPLPEAGRPADFEGIVGSVELTMTAAPEAIALGESVRLSVVARGPGNLWNARPRFVPELEPAEVEVFARPPESARDAGRALIVRRYFAFDLVPRTAGTLELPAVELAFFDPEAGRYRTARASGGRVSVAPERARPPAPTPSKPARASAEPLPAAPRTIWLWGAGAIGAATVGLALWRRRRAAPDSWAEVTRLAAQARASADPEERARAACAALRTALEAEWPGSRALSAEELAARTPDAGPVHAAVRLIGRIESARFGDRAETWSQEELEGHLAALRD